MLSEDRGTAAQAQASVLGDLWDQGQNKGGVIAGPCHPLDGNTGKAALQKHLRGTAANKWGPRFSS